MHNPVVFDQCRIDLVFLSHNADQVSKLRMLMEIVSRHVVPCLSSSFREEFLCSRIAILTGRALQPEAIIRRRALFNPL